MLLIPLVHCPVLCLQCLQRDDEAALLATVAPPLATAARCVVRDLRFAKHCVQVQLRVVADRPVVTAVRSEGAPALCYLPMLVDRATSFAELAATITSLGVPMAVLSICHPDSTITYYDLTGGIRPPEADVDDGAGGNSDDEALAAALADD
eukprot:m.155449 g.155449  ORF g.155449 m.155449 type:complete len:151 (-) comp10204_c0_seq3:107-559(-)